MRYRRLGNAGIKVSTISLGGWINFDEGRTSDETTRQVIEVAHEQGINFFDLANAYGRGRAEQQFGKIFKQFGRHTLVISTKAYWPMSDDVNDRGLSRKHLTESIHQSLRRLGTDYVDIYFCHRPDPETPLLETVRTMHDLITQGKVLYWGTSEWSAVQIAEAYALCERYHLHTPQVEEPEYSMLHRQRVEQEILPVTEPRGIGLVVWSPLAQGMLTGKYDEGVQPGTRFTTEEWARSRFLNDTVREKVRRLKPIADELGISRAQLALAWVLRQKGVSSVITGATTTAQVQDNVRAADISLTDDVIAHIEAILE